MAASATSRRRGCIGAALVCANPSVNPPCGVLPAPRKGEPFDVVSKLSRSPCRKAGFHMAEPYFTLRKQYFTRLQADFTAHVSAPALSSPRPDTRSHSLCAGRWVPRREGRSSARPHPFRQRLSADRLRSAGQRAYPAWQAPCRLRQRHARHRCGYGTCPRAVCPCAQARAEYCARP